MGIEIVETSPGRHGPVVTCDACHETITDGSIMAWYCMDGPKPIQFLMSHKDDHAPPFDQRGLCSDVVERKMSEHGMPGWHDLDVILNWLIHNSGIDLEGSAQSADHLSTLL